MLLEDQFCILKLRSVLDEKLEALFLDTERRCESVFKALRFKNHSLRGRPMTVWSVGFMEETAKLSKSGGVYS